MYKYEEVIHRRGNWSNLLVVWALQTKENMQASLILIDSKN